MTTSPFQIQQVMNVWYRNWVLFKRTWMVSLFWIVLEPVFILTAMGFGLGAYINRIEGVPYSEFFFPGLLCSSSMMIAFFEGTYGNFTKLSYSKVYSTQLLAPLTVQELIVGDIFWAAAKGTLSALAISIVGLFFGLVDSWWIFPALVVLFINAWIFGAIGMLVTALVKNYDQIIYPTSGLIVPMSLFGGTYFPIAGLNPAFKFISYLMPISHSVEIVRALALRQYSYFLFFHFFVLILAAVIATHFAMDRMARRLEA